MAAKTSTTESTRSGGAASRRAPARRSLVLSAAARPTVGGQGLNLEHMIAALSDAFDLRLFARGPDATVPTQQVPSSRIADLLRAIPVVRRHRAVTVLADDVHFDRWVAARLPRSDVFQGAVGQCAESLAAAKRLGARTALDVVNMHVDQLKGAADRECRRLGVHRPFTAAMAQRVRAEYARADVIRVMSRAAKRSFVERGFDEKRIVVATPPFDREPFPAAAFDEPVFRVAYVGLLEPWKGFHYLIEAFTGFPARDAELVLWGGSGHRAIARILGEARAREPRIVVRPTSVREAGLHEVYGRASVLVLPSLTDGFGYVVGEAMASGLPVIVTPDTGAVDVVADGVNGFVVPSGDAGAIRDRLVYLADRPDLVRRMGAAARETAKGLTTAAFRESWAPVLELL